MSQQDPRLRVLTALLAQGRTVHWTTGVLTLGALGLGQGVPALAFAAVLVWALETWAAARVGLDAALFGDLAAGAAPGEIDRGLEGLGLVSKRPERALAARIEGAMRLWRWQLVLATVQGVMVLLALLLGAS